MYMGGGCLVSLRLQGKNKRTNLLCITCATHVLPNYQCTIYVLPMCRILVQTCLLLAEL